MKNRLLSIIMLICLSIVVSGRVFAQGKNSTVVSQSSSDTIDVITKVTFKSKSEILNDIWYEKNGYKGYVYKTRVERKRNIYLVTYTGTLRRGPYVPNRIVIDELEE